MFPKREQVGPPKEQGHFYRRKRAGLPTTLSIFPSMEDPQDEHVALGQFIPKLVVSNQDAANFARIELGQTSAQARMSWDAFRARH